MDYVSYSEFLEFPESQFFNSNFMSSKLHNAETD